MTVPAAHAGTGRRRSIGGIRVLPTQELLALKAKSFWVYWRSQDLAFWAMCFYVVVEYIRPQQLIDAIYGWPLGQISLGLALAAFVTSGKGFQLKGPGTYLFLAFTGVIILSSLGAFDPKWSWKEFMEVWVTWVVIYFLIINVVNTEQRFTFFLFLWMLCHYYMSQGGAKQFAGRGFRFAEWGIIGAPGWFANSGEFAIAMCMFAFISWHFYLAAKPYLSKWRKVFVLGMPGTAVLGVIGSSSRGALVAFGAAAMYEFARSRPNPRKIMGLLALAVAVWIVIPAQQKKRFTTAGEDQTSTLRLAYWKAGLAMGQEFPVLGIGYANWIPYYARYYRYLSGGKVQVSHNIFIQCIAELGYLGLSVFIMLIFATPLINRQTRKLARTGAGPPNQFLIHLSYSLDAAMITYLVAGFFVTVLYYPFFWINLAMTVALNDIAKRGLAQRAAAVPMAPPVPMPVTASDAGARGRLRSGRRFSRPR